MIRKITYIKITGLLLLTLISNVLTSQIETRHVDKFFSVAPNGNMVIIGDLISSCDSTTGLNNINNGVKNAGVIKLDGDLENIGDFNFFGTQWFSCKEISRNHRIS